MQILQAKELSTNKEPSDYLMTRFFARKEILVVVDTILQKVKSQVLLYCHNLPCSMYYHTTALVYISAFSLSLSPFKLFCAFFASRQVRRGGITCCPSHGGEGKKVEKSVSQTRK